MDMPGRGSREGEGGLFGSLHTPPLAERLRPTTLDELVGQEHLTGPDGPLRRLLEGGELPSAIFWGPPGSGKTTLARILGRTRGYRWIEFSAVLSGVKDVRAAVAEARDAREERGLRTVLFVDEIHRFNRAQQDAFLPHVEAGTVTLLGATTENPSFSVNAALLSRCQVYVLRRLDADALRRLGERALSVLDDEKDPAAPSLRLTETAWSLLLRFADGDARKVLRALEAAWAAYSPGPEARDGAGGTTTSTGDREGEATGEDDTAESIAELDEPQLRALLQESAPVHQGAEDHFDWISALQKSIRGSDPDAALYWMTRMLEAGEDPLYVARRLVRTASEDIGLAEPNALSLALSARDAVQALGMPECALALAQAAVYLALAPKSNSLEMAYARARDAVRENGALPVPLHLRNAPTRLMHELGYGREYVYPHVQAGHWAAQTYLPEELSGAGFYRPSDQGREPRMAEDHRRRTRDFYRIRAEESVQESGPDERGDPGGDGPSELP